jgi:hypothetical protein
MDASIDPALVDLFKTSAAAVVGVVGTLATQWLTARFSNETSKASLKAENTELIKREAASQTKVVELQAYIEKHLSKRAILATFTVEKPSGDLVRDGLHFCPFCFHSADPPTEVQMQQLYGGDHWCRVCGKPEQFINNNA